MYDEVVVVIQHKITEALRMGNLIVSLKLVCEE